MIDTNSVNPNLVYVGEKIDQTLSTLSAKLGVATDHFWPVLVKQEVINGYVNLGIWAFFVLIILIGWGFCLFIKKKNDEVFCGWVIFMFAITFIFGGISIGTLSTTLNRINNPEAITLSETIKLLKK